MKHRYFSWLIVIVFVILLTYTHSLSEVTQVTFNSDSVHLPTLYNGTIAWSERDGGPETWNIYYWNGSSIQQITNNNIRDMYPSLYDGKMAWVRWDSASQGTQTSTGEIYYRDGTNTIKVTDVTVRYSNFSEICPSLHAGKLAFSSWDGNDYEIYIWDGTDIIQLTDNTVWDACPSLFNGNVAWVGQPDPNSMREVLYWDGTETKQITQNSPYHIRQVSLYDGRITWYTWDGSDYEVFYWNGNTIIQVTDDDNIHDRDPSLYNGKIAWNIHDFKFPCHGQDAIGYWDTSTTYIIHGPRSWSPSLYDDTIAFISRDPLTNRGEIYYWDGGSFPGSPEPLVTVECSPETWNLKSKGKWLTCYVELPEEYIHKVDNVELCIILDVDWNCFYPDYDFPPVTQGADYFPGLIGDNNNNGIPDITVKFLRGEVYDFLVYYGVASQQVDVTIRIPQQDGECFARSDTIFVINKGLAHSNEDPSLVTY